MSVIDKRFVLIAENGDRLYPYKKNQRKTSRFGYALSRPGDEDKNGGGEYTEDLEEVIEKLVVHGWNVRAKAVGVRTKREGTFGIAKRSIKGYEIDRELLHLVDKASIKPLNFSQLKKEDLALKNLDADTPEKNGRTMDGFMAKSESRISSSHVLSAPHSVYCFGLRDTAASIIGVKFGYTNDISRRLSEINKYRDFDSSRFEVLFHQDTACAGSAEELEQIVLKCARETRKQTSVEMFKISETEARNVWSAGLHEWSQKS